jgi:hypothetical protein
MATTTAMTPAEATAAIRDVRDYRQGLTGRAAGIVWMVWGFALAILASADMVGLVTINVPAVEGTHLYWPGLVPILMPILALAAGALVTNAVWKAHALERGDRHRSWVAWVAIPGLLLTGALIGYFSIQLSVLLTPKGAHESTYIMIMPLVAAVAAAVIAVLQRRRVGVLPGLVGVALLVALEFLLPVLTHGTLEQRILQGIQTSMLGIFTVFIATGFWYYKRG